MRKAWKSSAIPRRILLAQAVKELFPEAQVTIGPVIEDGFFYDFSYKRPFTPEDLLAIEKKMAEIAKADLKVERKVLSRSDAIAFFKNLGEHYKAQIIESIPSDEDLSLYTQGDFTDLCRGPHVPSTGKLKVFKLMKVAGAYWRGDSKNEMLQRIYGTAWAKKEDQEAYLHRLEEAEKRDHRKTRQACSTCSIPRKKRRAWCSGIPRAGRCTRTDRATCAAARTRPAMRKSARRRSWIVAVGDFRPLVQLPRAHVHHADRGRAHLRGQADELPGAHVDVQRRA